MAAHAPTLSGAIGDWSVPCWLEVCTFAGARLVQADGSEQKVRSQLVSYGLPESDDVRLTGAGLSRSPDWHARLDDDDQPVLDHFNARLP